MSLKRRTREDGTFCTVPHPLLDTEMCCVISSANVAHAGARKPEEPVEDRADGVAAPLHFPVEPRPADVAEPSSFGWKGTRESWLARPNYTANLLRLYRNHKFKIRSTLFNLLKYTSCLHRALHMLLRMSGAADGKSAAGPAMSPSKIGSERPFRGWPVKGPRTDWGARLGKKPSRNWQNVALFFRGANC